MLKLSNLTKKFENREIIKNFNLEVFEGEMIALMGKSGSGKSTLLNIIGLIEPFEAGTFSFFNDDNIKINSSYAQKMIREKISYLFQNFALVDNETVKNNLLIALHYVKKSKKEKQDLISQVLEKVGLPNFQNRKISTLSGGEQQRVALARTFLKPSVLVLADEPTGSLDSQNRDDILDLLHQLNQEGKTIIIVTHDPIVAQSCTRIVMID